MALRGRFAAHLAYHEGDARASGVMGMSPCIKAGDPAGFVSWRALRVSNFAQTAAVQASIVLPNRGLALLRRPPLACVVRRGGRRSGDQSFAVVVIQSRHRVMLSLIQPELLSLALGFILLMAGMLAAAPE